MAVVRDWQAKLDKAIDIARTAQEGREFFVEMCSNPLRSTWITTGTLVDDGTGNREIHTRLVGEPSNFPTTPPTKREIHREGYRRYLQRVLQAHREGDNIAFTPMSIANWIIQFDRVTIAVDRAIRDCHGVKCYEDGDVQNEHPTNIFFLHVCDVFNMYVHRLSGTVPTMFITTNSLNSLWLHMRNDLLDSIMNQEELDFLLDEIDYFYNVFAYYGNFSFVPIRTLVNCDDDRFTTASFYTNNEVFKEHQRGKLLQISQDHQRMLTSVCYRTV
jgi:hypothetical protein